MQRGVVFTTAAIMAITLLSRLLGFVRETAIAAYFGASVESDAYFIAYSIPGVLFAAMAAAIGTTFIPVYQRLEGAERERFMHNATTVIGLVSLVTSAVAFVFAPGLVRLFAPGFGPEAAALTADLSRILLWMIVFLTLNAIFTAYLQSRGRFLAPAAVGIPFNVVVVGYLLVFGRSLGIAGFTWVTLLAVAVQVVFLLPSMVREGYRYRVVFDLKEPGIRQVVGLIGPVMIGTVAAQLNVVVDRMLASGLSEGSISALNYSNKVVQLAYGIVVLSVLSVLYPRFSRQAADGDLRALRESVARSFAALMLILVPITVGSLLLARPIIAVLFERGAFDARATELTAGAFFFFSLGLIGLGTRELWTKAFYALQDTRTPMLNGVIAIGLNIGLNLLLVGPMQHLGLALATSIALTIASLMQYVSLRRRIGGVGLPAVQKSLARSALASAGMGAALWPIAGSPLLLGEGSAVWRALVLMAVIAGGGLLYVGLLSLFREPLWLEALTRARGAFRRRMAVLRRS
ncbi:murein biosynthesis integral membrane protein MurJ [Hydrogenibacillus sp. N12]|uniref:murein biosynthesis integral membrane protein MurJ n=1 Tax=Hydrogenibacillus sp. N12 TaxID=2866627 RepID=UPI001C7D1D0B|nr:murein biosynthesis integral membrane protein MurJ [Hydrogenibacillus sp. N12]QZA32533.1 murein biosynthesis integral membrane protein MurJ [Hydrogenibacillus sp. N12]